MLQDAVGTKISASFKTMLGIAVVSRRKKEIEK